MPGPVLVARVEIDPVAIPDGDIAPLLEALSDWAPVLEEIGDIMSAAERQNFATQGQTFGFPWPELSPATIREKRRQGFPETPMVRTGALEAALGEYVTIDSGNEVTSGLDLAAFDPHYPLFHQPAEMGGQNEGGRLPARVLIAFSPQEKEEIQQAITDFLMQKTGGLGGINVTLQEV